MTRRDFIQSCGLAGMALAAGAPTTDAAGQTAPPAKLRGANLGGWLALEKWIAPAVYAGTKAEDEYTLCQTLGRAAAEKRLKHYRETWITADDFRWIAARGLNAVRLPVNYGVAEENPPFIPAWDTVQWAFRTAKANGIGVLLDLHGVPGSQNGFDHSGRAGALGWHTSPANIAHSLRIVEDLAARCAGFDNLIGLEVLNEPRWDVPLDIIKTYYQDAYRRVRKHIPPERAAVVIHDAFRPREWSGFMQPPEYRNVLLDTHQYQCFTDEDRKRDIRAQIELALVDRRKLVEDMQKQLPCIVGEWSLGMPPESLRGLGPFARDVGMRGFADAQLLSWEPARGWFFWTYKTAGGGGWSLRDSVARGWMPARYGAPRPPKPRRTG